MLRVILYHLHYLKNVKITHGRMLLLVKLQTKACIFRVFLNCATDIKLSKASNTRMSLRNSC